jgi:hypothetical protein
MQFLYITFSISHITTSDEISDTSLQITAINNHQYGYYTCSASNILGSTEMTINVYGKYCLHKYIIQKINCFSILLA